ncbi:hypothetical protein M413DRAFT_442517 [Hebeloma cylindrosporum]|uniref:Uncharacterized protein n=1 Tax=Hebeloma cylindrosporum TaxID=76867 RepID=A0A0C3CKA9_HEBCY|nr:hypothetical protein M413DRAFT_442517 [Hebeloma cylindrosporum h7]
MQKLRGLAESHRATIASATKRAKDAEQLIKPKEELLKKRTQERDELEKRVYLMRQYVTLSKDLKTTRQKLEEAEKKLLLANDKASHLEAKLQSLHAESDTLESKYQNSRRRHNELISEMENLGFN